VARELPAATVQAVAAAGAVAPRSEESDPVSTWAAAAVAVVPVAAVGSAARGASRAVIRSQSSSSNQASRWLERPYGSVWAETAATAVTAAAAVRADVVGFPQLRLEKGGKVALVATAHAAAAAVVAPAETAVQQSVWGSFRARSIPNRRSRIRQRPSRAAGSVAPAETRSMFPETARPTVMPALPAAKLGKC
jgi:hypothetical protein